MTNVLAADIGGTNLRVALVDEEYQILERRSKDISGMPHDEVYGHLESCISDLLPNARELGLAAIGLSLSGHVEKRSGTVTHFDGLKHVSFNIAEDIGNIADGLPCVAINDGTSIALAEWKAGAAQGKDNVVSVHFGTYTAGGVIVQGRPVEKRTGSPLLGAMLTEEADGSIHEANLDFSGAGFEEILARHIEKNKDSELARNFSAGQKAGEHLFVMAQRGNSDAIEIYRRAGHRLGIHLASIMNVFDPEIVTLGGRMMDAREYFLPEAINIVNKYARHSFDNDAGRAGDKIVEATHGSDGGIIGAAVAARMLVDEPDNLI